MKIGQPRFITLEEAVELHKIGIETFGGSPDIRDVGLLDSALAQPRTGFGGEHAHEFPFGMAAAYAFHIAKNHPCVDGNKRLALMCCVAFLRMNGWNLTGGGTLAADRVIELVMGSMTKAQFADWLHAMSTERPSLELRDFLQGLSFQQLHELITAASAGSHNERTASMLEAMEAIPIIRHAAHGAVDAEHAGDHQAALILRVNANLMTALYRIAEDMGYDW